MRPDVHELERFYASKLGEIARRLINVEIRQLWPDTSSSVILGIGYATPFLQQFSECNRTLAFMPATQGVWPWPISGRKKVALGREDELPFADNSIDRIILSHSLECTPHINRLMRESWRVLSDGGRLITIVPNRHGSWCWTERTPFGSGQPYSHRQMERILNTHLFSIQQKRYALFMPPLPLGFLRHATFLAERLGLKIVPQISGVLVFEARKEIYMVTPAPGTVRPSSRRYFPLPQHLAARYGVNEKK